jgi:hypothetical protein
MGIATEKCILSRGQEPHRVRSLSQRRSGFRHSYRCRNGIGDTRLSVPSIKSSAATA